MAETRAPHASLNLALIHWPVFDRARKVVCTNVTNFDIHDIARAGRTYGAERYFIVNRMQEQLSFVARVLDHWRVGVGSEFNPQRKTALAMVELAETLDEVIGRFERKPLIVCTSARELGIPKTSFKDLRRRIWEDPEGPPVLLVFGTGFGLTEDILKMADLLLEPLKSAAKDDFRHLSVRSAVSIVLDRLMGAW